jgi:NADPH:quinone reductase-like Zn-dependent oxidoreductase
MYDRYGPPEVLALREVADPVPGPRELLVRTCATTVSSGDHRARSLHLPASYGPLGRLVFGVFGPRQPILGSELSGHVEAVGAGVRRFKIGDAVFASTAARMGCHAELRCIPEDGAVAAKPARLSFAHAAALSFGGAVALRALRTAKIAPGERVLVNGASGAVGTACVQLARHLGAEVTGVCSAGNADLVRFLGAAHVLDYAREDLAASGPRYDVVLDTAGTAPYARARRCLAPRGRLVHVQSSLPDMLGAPWRSLTSGHQVTAPVVLATQDELEELARLAEAGALTPVIDRTYPFDGLVEAHRYVDTGRKRGSVVVTVRDCPPAAAAG